MAYVRSSRQATLVVLLCRPSAVQVPRHGVQPPPLGRARSFPSINIWRSSEGCRGPAHAISRRPQVPGARRMSRPTAEDHLLQQVTTTSRRGPSATQAASPHVLFASALPPPPSWLFHAFYSVVAALAVVALSACVGGFLLVLREMVISCRAVTRACAAVERTCLRLDAQLQNVDQISATTSSVLESAAREAGLLQRRLSDLPSSASRTLLSAITQQYGKDENVPADALPLPSATACGVDVEIGTEIPGGRVGGGWSGGGDDCGFSFSEDNRFRVGEYVAVPRTLDTATAAEQRYTWGVIELDDEGIQQGQEDQGDMAVGLSCEWPPVDPWEARQQMRREMELLEANRAAPFSRFLAKLTQGNPSTGIAESADPGNNDAEERREYKVVVELSTDIYSFKIVPAGDLGKRSC